MRSCPVCGAANDDLAMVCASCKGYIQAKVDTLDLFHTLWGLMESPSPTMRRIAIARHKNYVLLLSACFGISSVFGLLWLGAWGPKLGGLGPCVLAALSVGPFVGWVLWGVLSAILRISTKLFGGHSTFRETGAVLGYSFFPIVLTLFFLMPVELAVFGQYLFDNNPPPIVINPTAYVALCSLDAVAVLWSWILLVIGVRIANRMTAFRATLASLSIPIVVALLAEGLRRL